MALIAMALWALKATGSANEDIGVGNGRVVLVCWLSQTRFVEVAGLMAHQWEQVRSQILGLTIQVKAKFAA